MKITGENPFVKLDAYVKNIKQKGKVDASSEHGSGEIIKEDNVVLSPEAKEIQEAKRVLDSLPDVREEKVREIKRQVENGTYRIEEKKIAAKIVRDSLLDELQPEEERD